MAPNCTVMVHEVLFILWGKDVRRTLPRNNCNGGCEIGGIIIAEGHVMQTLYYELFEKYKPPKPSCTHKSDERVVISVDVIAPKNTASLPKKLLIVMEEALESGVPVQVQLEIIPHTTLACTEKDSKFPDAPGFYAYHCSIESVKARIKSGTKEFIEAEEKNLDHIINGTEDLDQERERAKSRMAKVRKKSEANRFTGLEIS